MTHDTAASTLAHRDQQLIRNFIQDGQTVVDISSGGTD
jgi:hypothetical protein